MSLIVCHASTKVFPRARRNREGYNHFEMRINGLSPRAEEPGAGRTRAAAAASVGVLAAVAALMPGRHRPAF